MATQIAIDKNAVSQFPEFNNANNTSSDTQTSETVNNQAVPQNKVQQVIAAEKLAQQEELKAAKKKEAADNVNVEEAIEVISEFLNLSSRSVNFQQHEDSEKTIIKVYDNDTNELIRQFPSDEILEIAKRIVELKEDVGRKTGILLDEKV